MRPVARKLTREQTRLHNRRLILRTIYEAGEISRADIARATRLTRTTVSDAVGDLMVQALVEEVGYGPSAGGKPPMLLSVAPDSRHVIGVDLARDGFDGAVVNLRGQIHHRVDAPLDDRDGDEALALVYEIVQELIGATERPVLGIGVGSPGLMDAGEGVVRRSVNLDWRDLPLRDLLEARFDLPVYVANDAQVAALGEYTFGYGPGAENLVVVKVGRGVGAGIVLNGQLFHGETFGAGEIGHVTVVEDGRRCRCGNVGCLETVASARAITAQARALASEDANSLLHRFAARPEEITIEAICRAMEAGDEEVRGVIERAGSYLGLAVANIVGLLGTRHIIIAGSVACFGETLLDVIRQEMVERSLSAVARDVEIGLSRIGPDIVILGASAQVLNGELGLFASPEAVV